MTAPNEGFNLSLANPDARYLPGETVRGVVKWSLDQPPEKVVVHLKWKTRSKGNVDSRNVAAVESEGPLACAGEFPFSLDLPAEPYSFSARQLSIIWKVEACLLPKVDEIQSRDILVSPTGEEILANETLAAFEVVFYKKEEGLRESNNQ